MLGWSTGGGAISRSVGLGRRCEWERSRRCSKIDPGEGCGGSSWVKTLNATQNGSVDGGSSGRSWWKSVFFFFLKFSESYIWCALIISSTQVSQDLPPITYPTLCPKTKQTKEKHINFSCPKYSWICGLPMELTRAVLVEKTVSPSSSS